MSRKKQKPERLPEAPISVKDAMHHAQWAVANNEAWAQYLWDYLEKLARRIESLEDELRDLR